MDESRKQICDYLELSCQYFLLPGLSVGILCRGKPLEIIDMPQPQQNSTAYKVGSLTKLVTAITVLLLREDGALRLSDPVSLYLPWFEAKPSDGSKEPMTLRDLLLHTSGLPRGDLYTSNPSIDQIKMTIRRLAPLDVLDSVNVVKYSNLGYILLGLIIEAVSRESYASFVRRRLFDPLDMTTSGFDTEGVGDTMTTPHRPVCFLPESNAPYELGEMPLLSGPHSSFDMFSTVAEFSKILSCLLANGVYEGVRVLEEESVSFLLSMRHPMSCGLSAGPGFNVVPSRIGDIYFESAEHFGHSASMLFIPDQEIALLAMTNRGSAGLDLSSLLNTIQRYLTRNGPLDHRYREPEALLGTYTSAAGSEMAITASAEGLQVSMDGESSSPLVYMGQGRFLKLAGCCRKYIFLMDCTSEGVLGFGAGPHYFSCEGSGGANQTTPSKYSDVTGIYKSPAVGRIAVFERSRELRLAFSPCKETMLEKVSATEFVQREGPFAGERVTLDHEAGILRFGAQVLDKTEERF